MGSFLGTARDRQLIKTHSPTGGASLRPPGQRARGHTLSISQGLSQPHDVPGQQARGYAFKNFPRASSQPHDVPGQWARGSGPNFTPAAILASARGNPGSTWAIVRLGRPRKSTGSRGQMEDTPEAQCQSIWNSDSNPRLRGTLHQAHRIGNLP